MNPFHYVYLTTNLINGKIYIGVHSQHKEHDYYFGSGHYLMRALRKYGQENFTKEILYKCETREEAFILEKLLVTEEWVNSRLTYNKHTGGRGNKNEHTLSARQKMSQNRKGKCVGADHPCFGKEYPLITKKKISIANKGKKRTESVKKYLSEINTGQNHPQWGKPKSEETKRKLSLFFKGRKRPPEVVEKILLTKRLKKENKLKEENLIIKL
jgi:hypothetical protein